MVSNFLACWPTFVLSKELEPQNINIHSPESPDCRQPRYPTAVASHNPYSQCFMELVLKLPPPDAGATLAAISGVSCLHHEVLDVPMDKVVIVIAARTEGKEVLGGKNAHKRSEEMSTLSGGAALCFNCDKHGVTSLIRSELDVTWSRCTLKL